MTATFQKEQQRNKLVMIPLNLDGHLFNDDFESGWKSDLIARHAPDFTNWKRNHDKFEKQVELVIQALRADGGGRQPDPVPKL